jgi:hypothetical protein
MLMSPRETKLSGSYFYMIVQHPLDVCGVYGSSLLSTCGEKKQKSVARFMEGGQVNLLGPRETAP